MNQHQRSDRVRRLSSGWRRGAVVLATGVLLATACGGGSDSGSDNAGGGLSSGQTDDVRTIEVNMLDNEFSPDRIEVSTGETVRFVFSNEGNVAHDAVVGDEAAQAEHEEEMRAAESASSGAGMGGMDHGPEGEGGAITVDPGETGELTYTFAAGEGVLIGCHEPGHYDAGMKIAIDPGSTAVNGG
jgi:uncharacterized cupredoxin-like copper-binding protein